MVIRNLEIPKHSVRLTFQSADTEELQNLQFDYPGDRAFFKLGEGETNHYLIPNDKKLLDSQILIFSKNGKYYIRDLGYVHTSRIKLDLKSEYRLQENSIVDIGKVVHYKFDKLTHAEKPEHP